MTTKRLTQRQRRAVDCPSCDARPGRPCKGSRIPSANTFGGGWGGPPPLDREHKDRVVAARERLARRLPLRCTVIEQDAAKFAGGPAWRRCQHEPHAEGTHQWGDWSVSEQPVGCHEQAAPATTVTP